MRRLVIASAARAEIREILEYSGRKFGAAARVRYRDLIDRGLAHVRKTPEAIGVLSGSNGLSFFALRRLKTQSGVAEPRHIIVFRYDDDRVDVLHVYHDAMDLPARLSDL